MMSPIRKPGRIPLLLAYVLVSVFALSSGAYAQHFEARVDRDEMFANETLRLDVVYAERADTDVIDFEALLPDFNILGIRPSSQTRFENFRRSSQTSWQLTLMPKRVGTLRIPAFSIDTARTRPIEIRVTTPLQNPEQGAPLSAVLTIDREQPFVGEQILIRITLSAARSVADLRGAPPEIPDTEITLVSQKEFQRILNGEPYQVNELVYAVFPQAPGILELPGLQYTGTLRRSQLVVARTLPRTIEILDPARHPQAGRKKPWFPASGVALGSEWGSSLDALRVGEPITRTIQIAAAGQRAAAISPLSLPAGRYKQYAEQPVLKDTETSTGILGSRIETVVLVPTEAGELRLPPVEIDWWDVEARIWKVARLPEETLRVAENDSATSMSTPTQLPAPPIGEPTETAPPTAGSGPASLQQAIIAALGLLCLLLLACCGWLLRRVRQLEAGTAGATRAGRASHGHSQSEASAFDQALRSIAECDPAGARRDILAWARIRWPEAEITRLERLRELTPNATLPEVLAALDRALYQEPRADAEVDYPQLAQLLKAVRRESEVVGSSQRSELPALYPS